MAKARDFPFYRDVPGLAVPAWLMVLAATFAGYLALFTPIPGTPANFVKAAALSAIPLAVLACVAGAGWRRLFGRVGFRAFGVMLFSAILNLIVSGAAGYVVLQVHTGVANPINGELTALDTMGRVLEFTRAAIQLIGEEVMTILPFLAVLTLCVRALGWSRRPAILAAWVVSSLLFAAAHLPTYDWNLFQCLAIIGTARVVLTIPYLITRNLWVSYGAHLINDVTLFAMPLVVAALR